LLLGLVEFLANRFDFLIGIAVLEAKRGRQPRVYEPPPFPVAQLQPRQPFRRDDSHHVRQAAAVLHCANGPFSVPGLRLGA